MPINGLGDEDTTIFYVAVTVIERPDAIIDRLIETAGFVEWNINSPTDPIRLIMVPIMIGFSFPIRFIIIGVMLAKTKNMIINGSCTFAASTGLPPNPSGIGLLTSCTIAGYAMNIVIPVAIAIM